MASPYFDLDISDWQQKTQELISEHPLEIADITDAALSSWETLWLTKIGQGEMALPLSDLNAPATVIGYFFEKLFARQLSIRQPESWRGGTSKSEKDLVCLIDPAYSIEVKTSGQLGTKIFGNRSYNQKSTSDSPVIKIEKSGYYITVNFFAQTITLIRFGWIDVDDWKPQVSATGQSATIKDDVYRYKLVELSGDYRRKSPVSMLSGVGPKRLKTFSDEGIRTVDDLLKYIGTNPLIISTKRRIEAGYQSEIVPAI